MEFINASQAHRIMILLGMDVSYPTVLKFIQDHDLGKQPAGKNSGWLVNKDKLQELLAKELRLTVEEVKEKLENA